MPRDPDSTADRHREDLDAALDDGGGCIESWSAATAVRQDDEATVSRRGFLATAAAATGTSVAALQALTGEATAASERADVTELTGEQRRALLGRALGDARSRRIRRALVGDGHEPQVAAANAVRTAVDGERYHTVVVPFETDGGDTQAYLTWSDNPEYEVQVAGFEITHNVPADGEPYWAIATYRVEAGEVVVETDELENFLGCDDVDWGCVLTLAGAYAATFASCAACVASSGWLVAACANCIAAILAASGATLTCDWCDD